MKILLADPDRDLVWSFKALLEQEGNEVSTAFDGAQVINKAFTEKYDEVILSSSIPRVNDRDIVKMLNDEKCPVILLLNRNINADILLDGVLANAYLSFPFYPYELTALSDRVAEKAAGNEMLSFGDVQIDVSAFLLCCSERVTSQEIDVFRALAEKQELDPKKAEPFIGSLNNKLRRLNKKTRIRYVMKEGYRLVTDYE